ncbi:MAG TPA: hypothetical protein VK563_15280, partial [Puia sp.]|nr:hypothetical protein [Puia sp.]
MKKMFGFFILYCFFQPTFGQTISVNIVSPRAFPISSVDSLLNIQAIVASTYTLSSVIADVSGRQASLVYNPVTGHYEGNLSLAGLSQGSLTLDVTAHDINSNQQTASETFIYHIRPLLIVDSPISWSVARPLIKIKARCVGTGGCSLKVGPEMFAGLNFSTVSFGDTADAFIDLSASEGMTGNLVITATDLSGATTQASRQILVENSPYLQQIFAGNDLILDFNYNKALVSNPLPAITTPDLNPYIYRSRIINIPAGDSTPILYAGPIDPNGSQLTPYGAIFRAVDTVTYLPSLMDWNAGSLYTLGSAISTLKVSGNYATWLKDTLLYLRNLQTVTNTFVGGAITDDVASNGVVAYTGNDYNVYRSTASVSTRLTDNTGNKWNTDPLTDGNGIVYTKTDPCCDPSGFSLHLLKGNTDTVLSNIGTLSSTRIVSYLLNNKFVAYPSQDGSGNLQIWRKDSLGATGQVTFFDNDSKAELLNPHGDLTLIRKGTAPVSRRYFASRNTGQISEIGSSLGQIFYRDSTWYLALGRMLYKIDLKSIPNTGSTPPPLPVISATDSFYCSGQGARKIRILNFPDTTAGTSVTVKLDNISLPVAPDTSFSISLGSIAAGTHYIQVTYSNTVGARSLTDSFILVTAVTPDVNVSSNISTVVNLTDPVILTAVNAAGGGAAP